MRVEKDIVVSAPVARVYELWTDFENFPRFMHHVEEVSRTGDKMLHWKAKLGPLTLEWDAEIKALVPNRTVTWRSTTGAENAGAVTLAEKGNITEMHVVIEYSPNLFEQIADMVTGEMRRSVEQDLERFRALAEGRDAAATDTSDSTSDSGGIGSKIAATVAGAASAVGIGSKDKAEDPPSTSNAANSLSSASSPTRSFSSDSSSRDDGDSSPSIDDNRSAADTLGGGTDLDTPVRPSSVEVEGLGSDESPGEAVGSTSPEEIAAAREALGGDVAERGSGSSAGMPGGSASDTAASSSDTGSGVPSTGEMGLSATGARPGDIQGRTGTDFLDDAAADQNTMQDSAVGAPGNPGDQADSLLGVTPTRGGMDASTSDAPAPDRAPATVEGAMGPSLMTYEAGTRPEDELRALEPRHTWAPLDTPASDSALGTTPAASTPAPSTSTPAAAALAAPAADTPAATAPASEISPPTTGGPAGPSLMTYEAGTRPDDATGGSDLGSMADDRTSLGSTTVSTGSLTDTGRATDTSGMAGGEAGFTTESTRSLAGLGDLGGGPDDVGGRATTPDLGHTPTGGGTGRGEGGAYGSSTTQSGGPASSGLPFDSTASGENTMGGNTMLGDVSTLGSTDRGDMVIATGNSPRDLYPANDPATDRGDMVIATGNSPRDLGSSDDPATDRGDMVIATGNAARDLSSGADDTEPSPAEDAAVGGTGATYTGGTGGWGTEAPDSPEALGWSPSSTDDRHGSHGETH